MQSSGRTAEEAYDDPLLRINSALTASGILQNRMATIGSVPELYLTYLRGLAGHFGLSQTSEANSIELYGAVSQHDSRVSWTLPGLTGLTGGCG